MKKTTILKIVVASATILATAGNAFAAPILANDSFDFLPNLGTDLGNFMVNLAPGVTAIVLVLSLIAAVVGVIYAISKLIGRAFGGTGGGRRYR